MTEQRHVQGRVRLWTIGAVSAMLAAGAGESWRARVVAPELGSAVPFNPWSSPTRDGWVAVDGRSQLRLPAGRYVVEWVSPAVHTGSTSVEVPPDSRVTVTLK